MRNLQFSINSTLEPEKLMIYIIDFESYKNFFPDQIKEVKILDRQDNEITTEETITFSTLIKRPFVQKSHHKITSDKELFSEILEGPAKGSTVNVTCKKNTQGTEVEFDAKLKLSIKAKFLSPLIKNFYKRYLTAIIYKITERDLKSQDKLK